MAGKRYTAKFTETKKWCNSCQRMLPHDAFSRNSTTTTGLMGYCKECNDYYRAHGRFPHVGR